jgi:hypothetical protein
MSVETITCPACGRALDREKTPDGYRVKLTGKPPLPCCQKAATDGHKVVGQFVTEPE